MFSLEMCRLLNYSFYFTIYVVLEFVLFTPGEHHG